LLELGLEARLHYELIQIVADQIPRCFLLMTVFYILCQCARLQVTGYSKINRNVLEKECPLVISPSAEIFSQFEIAF
jgi:hypothetical protein